MAEDGSQIAKVTSKQRQAIAALLVSPTVEEAAKRANVGARTLYRWIAQDPTFKLALVEAEGTAIDAATRRLIGLQEGAIATLEAVMGDKTAADGVRVRAALGLLDAMLRLRELRNVEQRLLALEQIINGNQRN